VNRRLSAILHANRPWRKRNNDDRKNKETGMAVEPEQHQQPANGQSPQVELDSHAQSLAQDLSKQNQPYDAVVMQLQRQLANAHILHLNYKHYHWHTYGPLFRDLHLLFDEFAEAVHATTDKLAERIRMIGQDPIFHPHDIVETASVKVATPKGSMRDMIIEADANLLGVIKELRAAVRLAEEEDDPGTADLLSGVVQIHEKHEWWLRDMLEKRDGLTL
jgi:starvation-inducible DNA-binding protein